MRCTFFRFYKTKIKNFCIYNKFLSDRYYERNSFKFNLQHLFLHIITLKSFYVKIKDFSLINRAKVISKIFIYFIIKVLFSNKIFYIYQCINVLCLPLQFVKIINILNHLSTYNVVISNQNIFNIPFIKIKLFIFIFF